MRHARVVNTPLAFGSGHNLAEEYARYVEHAVNEQLAALGRRELRAQLARKSDEFRQTFTYFPAWASAWLPGFAWTALRLELARRLPLKSFPDFSRELVARAARIERRSAQAGRVAGGGR
jgi:hypothetical protein